jgi:hypothetical protein
VPPLSVIRFIGSAVERLFDKLAKLGEFDWRPGMKPRSGGFDRSGAQGSIGRERG